MAIMNLGIIGYGFMGHCDAEMMATFSPQEVRLAAVADTNPQQLSDVPEGVIACSSAEELLKIPDINVVMISVPNPLHLEMVEKCAKADKNVICEKPAAMTVAQFDKMVQVTSQHHVLFTVHQQRRWDYDYRVMKEVYDQHLVGSPYIIKSQLYGVNGNMHDWHVYPEMGGGMLYDWGVHLLDQMLNMVQEPIDSLYAVMKNVINENVDDYFKIILRFQHGLTAEIELGTYYLTPKRAWFIGGDTGSAMIDGFHGEGKIVRTKHLLENTPGKITMTAAGPTRSFGPPEPGLLVEEPLPHVTTSQRDYFVHYLQALQGKENLLVQAEQVRRVLVVMDAVRESSRTGSAVRLEHRASQEG